MEQPRFPPCSPEGLLRLSVAQVSYPKTPHEGTSQLWSYSKHYSFALYMLCDIWSEDNRLFPNFPFPLTLCNSTYLPRASLSPVASGARQNSIAEHSHIHTGLGTQFVFLLLCRHKSHLSDPYKINVTKNRTQHQVCIMLQDAGPGWHRDAFRRAGCLSSQFKVETSVRCLTGLSFPFYWLDRKRNETNLLPQALHLSI